MSDLAPCPLPSCKGAAEEHSNEQVNRRHGNPKHQDRWTIQCVKCGLLTMPFSKREELMRYWNLR